MLDIVEIQKILPHRAPFLLVDRILEYVPGESAIGIKNVTYNEPFFTGHFPQKPIMPGVLIVEALAQTACIAGLTDEANKGKLGLFTGIEKMKLRRQVVPGDTLRFETKLSPIRRGMGKAEVKATVEGSIAAEGIIRFALIDDE